MEILFHTNDSTNPLLTKESLTDYFNTRMLRPDMLTDDDLAALTPIDRSAYNRARCEYASGGIVLSTPHVAEATRLLTQAFAVNVGRNSGHVGLMLDGDSTVGKTETSKALMRTVFTQYKRLYPDFESHGTVPVVYISVPAVSTGKLLMRAFADFFGLPMTGRESMGELRLRVVQALTAAGTQLIVVDEVQNLVGRSVGLGESVDVLKNLHNEVRATFVYAGFGLSDGDLLSGPRGHQLRGRFTILEMDRLNLSNPADRKTWLGLISGFEKKLPLRHHKPGTLKELTDYLFLRTSGSIGSLAKLLTLSTVELISNPAHAREQITKAVMDTVRLDKYAEDNYQVLMARLDKKKKPLGYPLAGLDAA